MAGLGGNFATRFRLERGVSVGEGAITGMLFWFSDSASSCFMMAAFSAFCAFFGTLARVFKTNANAASAVTTPMQRMVIIDACFPGKFFVTAV